MLVEQCDKALAHHSRGAENADLEPRLSHDSSLTGRILEKPEGNEKR
jgi:hypothetical protein